MTIREKEKGDGEEWTTLVTPPVHLNLPLKKAVLKSMYFVNFK